VISGGGSVAAMWSEFRIQIKQGTPLAFGTVIAALCSYVALATSARLLGPAEFGVLGAILAVLSVVAVALRPLHTSATHLAARAASDRRVVSGLTGPLLVSSIALTCVVAIAFALLDDPLTSALHIQDRRVLWVAAPLIGLQVWWLLESGLIAGMQRFHLFALDSIADAAVRALVIAPLTLIAGVAGSVAAYATGVAVAGALGAAQLGGLRWRLPRHVFDRELLDVGGGSILLTLAISAAQNLDVLFLRTYADPEAVGRYAACATIGNFLFALSAPLYVPLYPRTVRALKERLPTLPILASVLLPFAVTGVVAVGVSWAFGQFATGLFFGAQFAPAGDVLPAYFTKIVCLGAMFIVGQYALATRRSPTIVPGTLLALACVSVIPVIRPEPFQAAMLCATGGGVASILTLVLQRSRSAPPHS